MITAKVTGIPDLREALRGIVPKLRVRALRNALAAGARVVQAAARSATPVIAEGALAVRKGYRTPGTVRKAISVRTSKTARAAGDVGVFVNVRPAKGARYVTRKASFLGIKVRNRVQVRASQRGARSPHDPYYWRFLTFKTRGKPLFEFMQAGVKQLSKAREVFIAKIGPAIEKLNQPKAPPP